MPIYRYACDVIDELRQMYKTRNFAGFLGSAEELQGMVSRMESKLREYKYKEELREQELKKVTNLGDNLKEAEKLREEVTQLKAEKKTLTNDIKSLRHEWMKETKGGTQTKGTGNSCNESMDGHLCCCNRNADMMPCNCPNKPYSQKS